MGNNDGDAGEGIGDMDDDAEGEAYGCVDAGFAGIGERISDGHDEIWAGAHDSEEVNYCDGAKGS